MTHKTCHTMKSTEKFRFEASEGKVRPTILLRLHERDVVIYPLSLFELLWNCNEKRIISPAGIEASFQIFEGEVIGRYYDRACGSYSIEYNRNDFINSAIQALKSFCHHVIKYNESPLSSFTSTTAEHLLIGLNDLVIPKNYIHILSDEVNIEEFSFRFLEPYSCDTHYEIKIGDRAYDSWLSDWTNDFNRMRNVMETFVYSLWAQANINICFEDSPTTLKIGQRRLFMDNDGLSVTIVPDTFSHRPIVFGWCRPRQLIRALYLGLLELFVVETDYFEHDSYGDWDQFRLQSYNQLQSNVIEDYIMGGDHEATVAHRNRVILSVPQMLEDYSTLKLSLYNLSL